MWKTIDPYRPLTRMIMGDSSQLDEDFGRFGVGSCIPVGGCRIRPLTRKILLHVGQGKVWARDDLEAAGCCYLLRPDTHEKKI